MSYFPKILINLSYYKNFFIYLFFYPWIKYSFIIMKHASEQENITIWTKYLCVLHSYLFSIRYF